MDLQRQALLNHAKESLKTHRGATFYFKYTCKHCKRRVCFSRPNILYAHGDCYVCGGRTKVEGGGYMLVFPTGEPDIPKPKSVIEDHAGAGPTCFRPTEAVDILAAIQQVLGPMGSNITNVEESGKEDHEAN